MSTPTRVPADQLANLANNAFPSESEAYRVARHALLAQEIEFCRHMTRVAEQRRALPPGPIIQKNYRFHDANEKVVRRHDLFFDKDTCTRFGQQLRASARRQRAVR